MEETKDAQSPETAESGELKQRWQNALDDAIGEYGRPRAGNKSPSSCSYFVRALEGRVVFGSGVWVPLLEAPCLDILE